METGKTLKVDLRNIPEALTILRAELARQKETAPPNTPWAWQFVGEKSNEWCMGLAIGRHDERLIGQIQSDEEMQVVDCYCSGEQVIPAKEICQAMNLNLARLRVAEGCINGAEVWIAPPSTGTKIDERIIRLFASLAVIALGVEVIA